jgi:enamine deaminase RidA (YjgF/YER057c/UK114 family)
MSPAPPDPLLRLLDGTGWEDEAGYSRAARSGCCIAVSGTTDTGPAGVAAHPGDTHAQTRASLQRAVAAAGTLGARPDQVLRTRLLLAPGADWRAAARAHAEVLGEVAPANTTLFVGGLIGEGFLVEVELDACTGPAA